MIKEKKPSRVAALLQRKSSLEASIDAELKRPAPCSLRLQALKRQRLMLKDAVARMRLRTAAASRAYA